MSDSLDTCLHADGVFVLERVPTCKHPSATFIKSFSKFSVLSFFSLSSATLYHGFNFSTSYFKTDEQEEDLWRQFLQYLFLCKRLITENLGQNCQYQSEFEVGTSRTRDKHVVMERILSYLIYKTRTFERETMKAVLCRPNTVTWQLGLPVPLKFFEFYHVLKNNTWERNLCYSVCRSANSVLHYSRSERIFMAPNNGCCLLYILL